MYKTNARKAVTQKSTDSSFRQERKFSSTDRQWPPCDAKKTKNKRKRKKKKSKIYSFWSKHVKANEKKKKVWLRDDVGTYPP